MRAQIANLEAKNAAETSVLRAQITEILDRLNALSPSQGMYHYSRAQDASVITGQGYENRSTTPAYATTLALEVV